jgi:protein-tyrosine phosphatase
MRILFVCQGNIIRSPLAENLFRQQAAERGLSTDFIVDSAGTSAYHLGQPPDHRMRQTAARHGYEYSGRARPFERQELAEYDLILAMDQQNLGILRTAIERDDVGKLRMLREFDPEADGDLEVPDPYFGGQDGFEHTFHIVHRSVAGLLDHLERREW